MTDSFTIALAQLNPLMGDLAGNRQKAEAACREVGGQGADLVVFSECFASGYPLEDLVLKPAFIEAVHREVEALARTTVGEGPDILIGAPWIIDGKLYNAVLLLASGNVAEIRTKHELPDYGVFDDSRVFARGGLQAPMDWRGIKLGAMVCEDMWFPPVSSYMVNHSAEILIVINGSPYDAHKQGERRTQALARVNETNLPLIYHNQLGGQDELVFDGGGFVVNRDGSIAHQLPFWKESLTLTEWTRKNGSWQCQQGAKALLPDVLSSTYQACVLGLKDYIRKNHFTSVVIGLSGGIDSALTAAMAVDALGADRIHCVMLPSVYTSGESLNDAKDCADALGIRYDIIEIKTSVDAVENALGKLFEGTESGIAEENIQSRLRGLILMAISNKFGAMVVTTGNKSEMAVGYATLYGDMNGGFNPLKDLYKTQVFALSTWRNAQFPVGLLGPEGLVIPENVITKPPSAELREDQKDSDSLPNYHILDDILEGLIEKELDHEALVARGHDLQLIKRIEHLLYIAEYKRRQAPPGVKITPRNFGRDRRYPITNAWRDGQ